MKKILKKINNNIFLFTIAISLIFVAFILLTSGIGNSQGLVTKSSILFEKIYNTTYYGKGIILEIFFFIFLIPLIFIFKKKYIFNQKRKNIFISLFLGWPIIIYSLITLLSSIINLDIKTININEVIALILITLTTGLFEESICRGWLQNEFIERFGTTRKGVTLSIIISGFIFGITHIINYFTGQNLYITLNQVLLTSIIGISFGAIYYKTKNLWSVVLLHGFWNFSSIFLNINASSSCFPDIVIVNDITLNTGLQIIFRTFLTTLPSLVIILILLNKNSINKEINKNDKISEKTKKNDLIFKITLSVLIIIYLVYYAITSLKPMNTMMNLCPKYIEKEVKNYSEKIYNYKDYDLKINKNNKEYLYKFNIDNNSKLYLSNDHSNYKYQFHYEKVYSIAIFENDGKYNIIILGENTNNNVIVYYSDFITKDNISNNKEYISQFIASFKQVLVPYTINSIGYFEEDNIKYPLFVSITKDKYTLYPDGTIYKYTE